MLCVDAVLLLMLSRPAGPPALALLQHHLSIV
jgi:hypothetical protein